MEGSFPWGGIPGHSSDVIGAVLALYTVRTAAADWIDIDR